MTMESESSAPPVRDGARERSVSDVAREAFNNRLFEGDAHDARLSRGARPAKP